MVGMDWSLVAAIAAGSVAVVLLFALVLRLFKRPATAKQPLKASGAASMAMKPAPAKPASPPPAASPPPTPPPSAPPPAQPAPAAATPLNANSQFTDERTGDSSVPAQWVIWRNPQIRLLTPGGVSIRGLPGEKISGLLQRTGRGVPELAAGNYILRVKVRLADGDLRGSAAILTLTTAQAEAAPVATHTIRFGMDQDTSGIAPGAGQAGSTYVFEARFKVEEQALNVRLHLGASEKGEIEFLEAAIVAEN